MSLLSTRFPGFIKACSVIQFSWDSCSLYGEKRAFIAWPLKANASLMSVFEADVVDASLARLNVFVVQNGSRDPCLSFAKGCIPKPKNGIVSVVYEHNVKWWWGWIRIHWLNPPLPLSKIQPCFLFGSGMQQFFSNWR